MEKKYDLKNVFAAPRPGDLQEKKTNINKVFYSVHT